LRVTGFNRERSGKGVIRADTSPDAAPPDADARDCEGMAAKTPQ
jgi:hypothetical protein